MDTNSLEQRIPGRPEELLGTPITADYMPQSSPSGFLTTRNRPPFATWVIDEMLTDSKIIYGMYLLKGPILSNSRFYVQCEDTDIKDFIIKQINRFWRTSAVRALRAIEWGYSGSEVLYRVLNGEIHFDCIRDVHPRDTRVVTHKGELCGITVQGVPQNNNPQDKQRVYLGGSKAFLHTHWRDRHPWYGMSRCYGCYIPWWEVWTEGGYRDIRRLWYFKNAFEGGVMYHPPGTIQTSQGTSVSAKDYAREMIEKKRTGGVLTLPNAVGVDQGKLWEYIPPTANPAPESLLEYGDTLGREILEGLGIPPEVIESGGDSGFGSATGRQIPQTAFFAVLQELTQWLITDFDTQILRALVALKSSVNQALDYDIVVFPMDDNRGDDYNGNQFTDSGNEALNPGEQPGGDEETNPDAYKQEASKTLKKDAGFQMHTGSGTTPPTGDKKWVTIGGRSEGGKQHSGGFPVMLDGSGKILAGGPSKLHNTHVQEAGSRLSEMRDQPSKPYHDDSDPRHTPQRKAYNLPHPDSDLGRVLSSHSDDPEEQAAFHAHLTSTHAEHQKGVEDFRNRTATVSPQKRTYGGAKVQEIPNLLSKNGLPSSDAASTMLEGAVNTGIIKDQRDLILTMKKIGAAYAKTNDVRSAIDSVLEKRQARQQTAKNWQTVVREVAEEYKVDPGEFRRAADEYFDLQHGEQVKANKLIKDLRAGLIKQAGLEKLPPEEAWEKLAKGDYANIKGFDLAADEMDPADRISLGLPQNTEDGERVDNSDRLWSLLGEGPRPVPKKTDDAFVGEVLHHMGITPGAATDLPIHHPEIVNKAYKSLHNKIVPTEEEDTSFDTNSFGSDNF